MALTQFNAGLKSKDARASLDQLRQTAKPIIAAYYRPASLEVTAGLHTGAEFELPQKNLIIGSSYECDIVLLGDELRPRHARIRLANALGQKLIVEALEDDVGVNETDALGIGQTAELTLPATLELGKAIVRIEPRALSQEGAKWLPRVAFGLFLLIGLGLFGSQWWKTALDAGAGLQANTAALTNAFKSPASPSLMNDAAKPLTPKDPILFSSLQQLVATSGLKDQVRLSNMPDGSIIAAGALDEQSMLRWRSILQWYDGQKGAGLLVNRINAAPTQNDAPALASVWMDSTPQVMGKNGELAGVGDVIGRGWRISSIGQSLSFERNGQVLNIDR